MSYSHMFGLRVVLNKNTQWMMLQKSDKIQSYDCCCPVMTIWYSHKAWPKTEFKVRLCRYCRTKTSNTIFNVFQTKLLNGNEKHTSITFSLSKCVEVFQKNLGRHEQGTTLLHELMHVHKLLHYVTYYLSFHSQPAIGAMN